MMIALDKILQSQGFGSRKHCQNLIQSGRVCIDNQIIDKPKEKFNPLGLNFSVFGESHLYREKVYLALYKPQGYECSQQPQHHHSVFDLVPDYLRARGVQAVGRLDQDTTGLLLLSDDGQFLHRLTHPRQHVAKYYQMTTADDIDTMQIEQLVRGVELKQEIGLFQAHDVQLLAHNQLSFAVHQGVYHQVKRMLAAVGNRVTALHRLQIGQLLLEDLSLQCGQWCYLDTEQLKLLQHQN